MEFIELGKTGERIPVLGMGTWKLSNEGGKGVEALRAGISAGMTFIDSAEMYGTEDIVGEAIKAEKEKIFIATKVSPHNFHYDDVIKSCDHSLKMLGIKAIDLYQLHWPNPSIDIRETMRAMEKLVDDGKIRHIGVSNFSIEEVKAAQSAMKSNEIASNQVQYSVFSRKPEEGLSDFCKREKVTIIAYSPLGQGALNSAKNRKAFELLEGIGKKHGKSAAQVALNWLVSKGNVAAIPKAGSREHAVENAGSVGWKLSAEEISAIDSFFNKKGGSARLSHRIVRAAAPFFSKYITENARRKMEERQ